MHSSFFHADEHVFTSHHETINWTAVQTHCNLAKFMLESEQGPFASLRSSCVCVRSQYDCRSINQANEALRFLCSSFRSAVSWHISLREHFHLLLCSPFQCCRNAPLYFNLWSTERSSRHWWCHRCCGSMFHMKICSTSLSWQSCCDMLPTCMCSPRWPINADLHWNSEFM